MQREDNISNESLGKIIEAIYDGDPRVIEAYSEFDRDIREIPTKESLEQLISEEIGKKNRHKSVYCLLLYPGSNGFVSKRKIQLDPKRCDGATYRYTMEGWGVSQFQLELTKPASIRCRFAANSEKRANNWAETYPELGSPSLWKWSVVEKNTRRLIRVLRKNAKPI